MKKMIKMSLVAAVAVAGLTTTSSAANLEDAIKGTKLTGYVRYRINTDQENSKDMTEEGKVVAKITTPVNDMVTANVKTVSFAETQSAQTKADTGVTEANFVVKAGGATVIAGLQTSQSPFLANNGDTRSHGFTALVPAGPATIAAAYYTTTTGGGHMKPAGLENIMALGALAKFGGIGVNAWYASVQDTSDIDATLTADGTAAAGTILDRHFKDASAMSFEVTAKAGPVNVQAMMTKISTDLSTDGGTTYASVDTGLTKIVVSGKAGNISYAAGYAMTEKDSGMVSLDKDSDAKSDLAMTYLNMGATADATAFYLKGKMQVNDKVCASVAYLSGSSDAHVDFNEMDIKVGYKMSKNFGASLIYGMGESPLDSAGDAIPTTGTATDFANSRIEVKYTF